MTEEPVIVEPKPEEPQEVPVVLPAPLLFADVAAESWYYEAVRFVYGTGLMNGVSETAFNADSTTTRAMVATMLWRLSGSPEAEGNGGFDDVPMDQWYTTAIAWAAQTGLVTGYDEHTFGPNDPITREQLIAILYRLAVASGVDVSVYLDIMVSNRPSEAYESIVHTLECGHRTITEQLNKRNFKAERFSHLSHRDGRRRTSIPIFSACANKCTVPVLY